MITSEGCLEAIWGCLCTCLQSNLSWFWTLLQLSKVHSTPIGSEKQTWPVLLPLFFLVYTAYGFVHPPLFLSFLILEKSGTVIALLPAKSGHQLVRGMKQSHSYLYIFSCTQSGWLESWYPPSSGSRWQRSSGGLQSVRQTRPGKTVENHGSK